MTTQEEKIINDYLMEVVKNSSICANCVYNHGNGMCFFASECIKHDFNLTYPASYDIIYTESEG